MFKPQYVDERGQPIANTSPSLWERILGYRPRYVTPPRRGKTTADAEPSASKRSRRRATDNE